MRSLILFGLLCWGSLLYGQKMIEVIPLTENWYFSEATTGNWLPATVPGVVQQDLIKQQLLPEPFYGKNEEKIQWVEQKDWEYKTEFTVSRNQLERDAAQLTFEGLDTYADVYLNGALILKADNMFVGYRIPVKHLLKEGKNRLHLFFHSPIRQTLAQAASNGFDYPADNDHFEPHVSVFTRKAPYSYGWDWGIRMVTSGIWRPVTLSFYDVAALDEVYIRQRTLSDQVAELESEVTLTNVHDVEEEVEIVLSHSFKGEKQDSSVQKIILRPGQNKIILPYRILQPRLWMPNGWGEANLYGFTVSVYQKGGKIAEKQERIGLRTIRLVNEKDKDGECFYFEVNGIPMFAKGANYIPGDAILPEITTERYRTLFRDIKEANMNMVRVWGGGSYEDERFYDLADENGILVWQDFMFACTSYPHDPVFLNRVREETDYNIRRLRNHACLALWCGNNEILEALKYWGWEKRFAPDDYRHMFVGYDSLFRNLLPAQVARLDSGRSYTHSSPYFANWGRPDSWKIGDSHNWGVWYGKKPFESLNTDLPRFMSEFGFQSFPEMKTIASFAAPEDYEIESEVMNAHQKSTIGNALIRTYMERDYHVPEKFEDFVYVGLVMQGQGMREGFEAHRRNRPYCMGTLYWQLNDSWPVVSWSGIDYYGNWKALHYQAKRAFAPLMATAFQEKDSLRIWLLSDLLEPAKGLTLEMQLTDFNGKVAKRKVVKAEIEGNTSRCVEQVPIAFWVDEQQGRNCYLLLTLKDKTGNVLMTEPYFFNTPKALELPEASVSCKSKVNDGYCELTLSSDRLAKDVFIEVPVQGARFSDNFFDLLPGKTRKIKITSPEFRKGDKVSLTIRHLRDTYK